MTSTSSRATASAATTPGKATSAWADPSESPSGLAGQAAALADGTVTAVELVSATLDRIDAAQPTLNAFRRVRREEALADAAKADRRLARGERAPLLGVAVAIKDDMELAGETTPFGCPGEFSPAPADGEMVRRLREAGAVIVGKTTTPELGQWPVTSTPAFGITRNPWSHAHTPGGSSGGSATAVAAGLVAAAMGSDGAGSVRIPAAWTHLVGIKPQRGRVSTWPEPEAFNGIAVFGPLARTVGDAAMLLDAVTGNHPGDLHQPPAPSEPFAAAATREPGRLRIALSFRIPYSGVPARLSRSVRERVTRLAEVLSGLGHDVFEADPRYGLIGATFMPRSTGGLRNYARRVPDRSLLEPRTRHNIALGGALGGPVLKLARRAEPLLHRQVGAIFRRADVVLAPTTAKPPLAADAIDGLGTRATDREIVSACPYAWPWNVLGWPSVNVPAGFTPDGLPVGAQLMGPACSEPRLISLAAQLEDVERWHEKWPAAA
jgi:amidase